MVSAIDKELNSKDSLESWPNDKQQYINVIAVIHEFEKLLSGQDDILRNVRTD